MHSTSKKELAGFSNFSHPFNVFDAKVKYYCLLTILCKAKRGVNVPLALPCAFSIADIFQEFRSLSFQDLDSTRTIATCVGGSRNDSGLFGCHVPRWGTTPAERAPRRVA